MRRLYARLCTFFHVVASCKVILNTFSAASAFFMAFSNFLNANSTFRGGGGDMA